ncbi:MAG TPA: hypothetical protein VEA80_06640 [Vitreimonas sp.]|uniref:hypothetical protein n=1 Tax=Vitreimonas sp. TaxID=3069702 RepID=UPI002D7624B0|nr:hypothetical protein [Vitreimonas sp.]HYD87131.1 hypothetical protein [Vitreimonas sp.]
MSKFGNLAFKPVAVEEPETERVIKVAVTKAGAVKLTFNAGAYAELGKPDAMKVEAASADGRDFLQLTPAKLGEGWPVMERDAPKSENGRPSGSCSIKVHPFKPGVWHGAEMAEAEWLGGGVVVVAMPDWASMRPAADDSASEAEAE